MKYIFYILSFILVFFLVGLSFDLSLSKSKNFSGDTNQNAEHEVGQLLTRTHIYNPDTPEEKKYIYSYNKEGQVYDYTVIESGSDSHPPKRMTITYNGNGVPLSMECQTDSGIVIKRYSYVLQNTSIDSLLEVKGLIE